MFKLAQYFWKKLISEFIESKLCQDADYYWNK